MAKSYNGLFERMLTDESMEKAFHDASQGKRDRNDVKGVLANKEASKAELRELLVSETLEFVRHKPCTINEHSCQKERQIVKPFFKYEQVVHHLVVEQLKPIIMGSLIPYSCGSIPGRGCHYGKRHMERWIRSYQKDKPLYCLKMDVRHFFENVDHEILKRKLARKIRDKKFLRLCYKIIDCVEVGLPLGYYTSQWFANFYLSDFDHHMKEVLKADDFMRYMDDMPILSDDKEKLHEIRRKAAEYLDRELKLEIKDDWQVFPVAYEMQDAHGRAIDFMGFKFYRNHTTLRKSILRRVRRKANKIRKKRMALKEVTFKDATSIISRIGWIDCTDTYGYYLKYVKPQVIIRSMKHIVSKHQRKENKRHDRLENHQRVTEYPAPRTGYYFLSGYRLSEKERAAGGSTPDTGGRRERNAVGV